MNLEKGQKVLINYGTYHNPVTVYEEQKMTGTFERESAGGEYAVIRVKHLSWPFTHLHVRWEDLTIV